MTLQDALGTVRERVNRYRDTPINEQNTKATLIEPILRALGWDVEDLDEVQREFKPKSADNPVDYALLTLRTPRLFVEAKGLNENLEDRRWASQIMGYASVAGVEWVVLTNGDEYRIYNAHAPVPVEEKIFRVVRITDEESQPEDTLPLLSKERMQENQIQVLWKAQFVDRQVQNVVSAFFSPDPAPSIVNLIRKEVPSLAPSDIRASLNRLRIRFDYPTTVFIRTAVSNNSTPSRITPVKKRTKKATQPLAPSLLDLITAGIITPPMAVETTFKKQRVKATIENNGDITFNGVIYHSLSLAAGYARNSVSGLPKDGRHMWQTNGWTFWKFKDTDGQWKVMDVLRNQCIQKGFPNAQAVESLDL